LCLGGGGRSRSAAPTTSARRRRRRAGQEDQVHLEGGLRLATVLRLPQSTHNVAVVVFGARPTRAYGIAQPVQWATAKASTCSRRNDHSNEKTARR
jgi:hypothetical protein